LDVKFINISGGDTQDSHPLRTLPQPGNPRKEMVREGKDEKETAQGG